MGQVRNWVHGRMPDHDHLSPEELAKLLKDGQEDVMQRWRRAVLDDPEVPTADRLSLPKLNDYVPVLLDQLAEALQAAALSVDGMTGRQGRASRFEIARHHAHERYAEGFRLPEASRELLHLRQAIIAMCLEAGFCVSGPAAAFVHGALDETLIFQNAEMMKLERAERQRVEADLRRNEAQRREILATLPVAVFVLDRTGRIADMNDAARALWGGAKLIGMDRFHEYKGWWSDTGKPIEAGDWAAARAIRTGESSLGEVIGIVTFDGKCKTILNAARPLRDEEGAIIGAVSVSQDITALKMAEAEAVQAARDREDLVSIVSHDLKNPLAIVQLNAELLLRTLPATDVKDRSRARNVLQATGRMNSLIHDLLDLSRIRAGQLTIEPQRLLVRALVHDALESLEPLAAEKDQRLGCYLPSTLPEVVADRRRVLQVLSNLVGNAVKFTPQGGRICVEALQTGNLVTVSVHDNGSGIPPDELPHLFERFWQAKEAASRGTGLGLTIARGIVEAHGGRIWAESTVGSGSVFYFTLPVAGSQAEGADGTA